jgi:acyl phosphate:glycerol-3-phosphate acyltransferase
MTLFIALFVAYLVGSIPTGYLFAKNKNVDLRSVGSGNVGASNVLRSVGKLAALFTLLIDIFKGYAVVAYIADMMYSYRMSVNYDMYIAMMGFCAVAGHNWSLFLKFKGGKGIATSAGVLLGVCPQLLLVGLTAWVAVFAVSRIVSLASILSAVAIAASSYFLTGKLDIRVLAIALAVLTIFRHSSNIRRLINKEEKRIVVKI